MTPPRASTESRTTRRAVGARVSGLFDEHSSMVFGLCRLLLRDHHEAEDASQQTFVSAYRALLRGTEPREAGPWLAAIARNECRARLRKRVRAPIPLEDEFEIPDGADLADVADLRAEFDLLTDEIAKLPSRQREAIALRDFLGLSYEEVASTLSVSVPVVESLLFRARRRLRDSVRTVPRYAAGIVMVPVALRAAVARDVPDFDAAALGGGAAAGLGAAALAKLLSMPFTIKAAATTAAVVAAGSVVAPQLLHRPPSTPAAGLRMTALGQVEGQGAAGTATTAAAPVASSETPATSPAAESPAPVEPATAEPGTPGDAVAPSDEPALDPDRVSASTDPPAEPAPVLPAGPSEAPGEPSACTATPAEPCETPGEEPAPPAEPVPETDEPALTGSLDEVWGHILDSEGKPDGGQGLRDRPESGPQ
ncbi:MAG: sigma-70 family RNA polymerase sigma factor [Gaiellales bacterium]